MRRLFIDPASKNCGWAVFEGPLYLRGGAIQHNSGSGDIAAFDNLSKIQADFLELFLEESPDRIYIEQLVLRTHRYAHWSVGVIGACAAAVGIPAEASIPIKSWQKDTDYQDGGRKLWKERGYESEDHYAAYLMGEYWMRTKL